MSDTDTPIIPSPNKVLASGNSLTRFRYAFTSLNVFNLSNGRRQIEVNDDGKVVIFDLPADAAKHLARLLLEDAAS